MLTVLRLTLTLVTLDQHSVATALPRITGEFGGLQTLVCVGIIFVPPAPLTPPLRL